MRRRLDSTTLQVRAFLQHKRPFLAFLIAYRSVVVPVALALIAKISL